LIKNDTSEAAAPVVRDRSSSAGIAERIRNKIKSRIGVWSQFHIGPISHVATKEPVAALTFDDGPHPEFTPKLLDVFAKHGAHGTFFMLGDMARRYPGLVREVALRGHAVANHTTDHPSLPLVSRWERWKQLKTCSRALAPYEQKLFRPPYGQRNLGACIDAAMLGYSTVAWNVHAFDWLDHDAEWMANHLVSLVQPGCIIALHDALYHVLDEKYADRMPTIRAVDLLLERIGKLYRFVTVPELLCYGVAQRQTCFGTADLKFLRNLKPNDGKVREYTANAG
jgi:peptidoglycan/xylan/chitin deacetylase (PgdA/CDA1 family)